jgi:hypothetical protein
MTPFEIRLELVKLAKEMLSEEYHSKRMMLEHEWSNEVAMALDSKREPPKAPILPNYFSENDVIEKALRLNEFISGK